MQSTVSVIIPCYNAGPYIGEAIQSALAQTHPPLEILVIDDGSTDDSAAIARAFGPPVRVIQQENSGESAARNRGIDEAQGEWIAFLDADDVWCPEKLEKQLRATGERTVAVHTELYFFGGTTGRSHLHKIPPERRYDPEFLAVNPIVGPSSTFLVRRQVSPRFPEWTGSAEDLVYCLELAARGPIELVAEPLAGYRRHAGGQSAHQTMPIRWHTTIQQWMRRRPDLSPETCNRIRNGWMERISFLAWTLKEDRQWKAYWEVRSYLAQFRGHEKVDEVLKNHIYPRWVYSIRDLAVHSLLAMRALGYRAKPSGQPEEASASSYC